ncbi:Malic enzyme [Perkinsus chesapeaki]|uniref:Malic enzyme n=1 Tax=Perkinsus chesapeaki TaxID=330153 RepID=A0A7J6N1F2_PERCH|nr:Malic enzyme [Perkinsus chesapeaki]
MPSINVVQQGAANGSKANFDVRMLPMDDIVAAAPTEALIEWYHLVLAELYHRQSASPHLHRWTHALQYALVGPPGVGKTNLRLMFTENVFRVSSTPTDCVEFSKTIINLDENRVKLQIWDTVWGKFTASYCRGSAVIFFVYDVGQRKTYEELIEFIKENLPTLNKNVTKVLIGNKADLLGREVPAEEAATFARSNGILFMETSAKAGQRVRDAFLNSARQVLLQIQMGVIDPMNTPGVRLSGPESGKVATVYERGLHLMRNPVYNKAEAFTEVEREELGLVGLLPPKVLDIDVQVQRCLKQLDTKDTDIGRYIYLEGVHNRNETLYFRLLLDNITRLMPIVYTPSVGEACKDFDRIFRGSRGIYFNLSEKGNFKQVVWNSNVRDADIIVVTDGSRILGLGDLGTNGMGIPIGKLSLYVACAGINPGRTVPVVIDIGTNNQDLLGDPFYLGERHNRITGEEYYAVVDEFVDAVRSRWPGVLIQFEDFTNDHAFPLLQRYRDQILCFNDDIQGTGSVALAGLLTAMRAKHEVLADQRIVFFGAGSAAVGVADCIVAAMVQQGLTIEEARQRFWLVDSRGLVTSKRPGELQEHKVRFCRDDEPLHSLLEVVQVVKPTVLLGLSGQFGTLTEEIIKEMHSHCPAPVIFALSNPTPKAEATPEQLYMWTNGEAWVATGSPFKPVSFNGKTYIPGQGNNMYIFPGVGLAAIVGKFKSIPDTMFYLAAKTLSEKVTETDLAQGLLYPQIDRIRELSHAIAVACVKEALDTGIAQISPPDDIGKLIQDAMWQPEYSRVELDPSVLAYSGGNANHPRKDAPSKQTLVVSSSESKSFSFSDIERVNPNRLVPF